jgi:hypothetical protein
MELKEIAVISGKGGLFKILKPTRTGVIVESIDEKKSRFPVNTSNRMSVLEEISLYTKTTDGSTPLKNVLRKIYDEFKEDPGVTPNSDPDELRAFIQHIEPEYDEEKVYVSDIKKIVSWYNIILNNFPEILTKTEEEDKPSEKEEEQENEEKTVKEEAKGDEEKPEAKSSEDAKKSTK